MRKLVWLLSAGLLVPIAGFAHAQEVDITLGGSTLFSSRSSSVSQAFQAPPLKGGVYPSIGAEVLFGNHFGFSAETVFRYRKGLYNGDQLFRPVFYDFNGLYARSVRKRITGELMAGVGGETVLFYNESTCQSGTCPSFVNANHLMFHAGAGVRYYLLGRLFVRPEAHYYRIINNNEFHSGNILRLGASIGYTFGGS